MTTFTGTIERTIGNLLVMMIGRSAPDPDQALVEEDGVVTHLEPPAVHPSPGMLLTYAWLTLWRIRHYDPSRWQTDPIIDEVLAGACDLEKRDLQSLTGKQNIETLQESLALIPGVMQLRERYVPKAIVGLGTLWHLLVLSGHKDRFSQVISGVETNRPWNLWRWCIREDRRGSTCRRSYTKRYREAPPTTLQTDRREAFGCGVSLAVGKPCHDRTNYWSPHDGTVRAKFASTQY